MKIPLITKKPFYLLSRKENIINYPEHKIILLLIVRIVTFIKFTNIRKENKKVISSQALQREGSTTILLKSKNKCFEMRKLLNFKSVI